MIRLSRVSKRDLSTLVKQAREQWPQFTLAPERFTGYLRARLAEGDDGAALHVGDLYLACACVDGDPRAIALFHEHYLAQLPRLLGRARAEPTALDEVRQLLATRLLVSVDGKPARLDKYSGRGPLATWLRVAATRALSNLRRSRDGRASVEDRSAGEPHVVANADPELALVRRRFGADFHAALATAFASLEPRERNLLRLHLVDRVSIDGLAPIFQVSRATAARHLAAARAALTERTVEQLSGKLRLRRSELESLIRDVRSKLDVSLSAVLRV
jgi:RNA polymerase sigma-70 factor (ECF subfamily)